LRKNIEKYVAQCGADDPTWLDDNEVIRQTCWISAVRRSREATRITAEVSAPH